MFAYDCSKSFQSVYAYMREAVFECLQYLTRITYFPLKFASSTSTYGLKFSTIFFSDGTDVKWFVKRF